MPCAPACSVTTGTPVVLTAGQFNSGVRFDIIPEEARLVGTLRTFDAAVREDVIARFGRIAQDYAHAAGGSARYSHSRSMAAPVQR